MSPEIFIKICGITTVEDALLVWEAGADAIGLNFYPYSPRAVPQALARAIAETRPEHGSVIGVFVDAQVSEVQSVVSRYALTAVQLHGDEPVRDCASYSVPVIKALRVRGSGDLLRAKEYRSCHAVLLDGPAPDHGGGGVSFHWPLAMDFAGSPGAPVRVIVAGGLNPGNVGIAVRLARPYGVDVASGVERAPGHKDPGALRAFVKAAREAADEILKAVP